MMRGLPRREYTLDFKTSAVRQAQAHGLCATARALGLPEQTLRNWIRAGQDGKLAAGDVTPDRMESSRRHADEARHHRRQQLRGMSAGAGPQLHRH